ncbi:ABC transporter ATP-binding protein [Emergencia sp.]|uniref:ABC transporter ATP-binding protein n=1 Tax=Emergencia sp. TaxID=1926557 RepID=UPI003AEF62D3
MKKSMLEIKDLHVVYRTESGEVKAVNDVAFSVKKGDVLGIVGETGAGKSTTALSVLRLLPERTGKITSGSILFDGEDLLSMTEADMRAIRGERISMIFQDPMTSLNPVIPVGKQIAEAIRLHQSNGKEQESVEKRVDEILELVGIPSSRKNEYPHQFSGGMKQRVGISVALACEPELLIADEPTTALDVTIQAQVLSMMQDLKQKLDMSMVLITHDLGVVAEMCDEVAVMYAGEIIESGTVDDLFLSEKRHPYTDGLFGSIPDIDREERRLHPIEGLMPDPVELPEGCKFHPRCRNCMKICRTEKPSQYAAGTHMIRCHLFSEKKEMKK